MSSYIGIDLGTTFSVVATIDESGRPQIVRNPDSDEESPNLTPSCVHVGDETVKVGKIPYQYCRTLAPGDYESNGVIARFKQEMGTSKTFNVKGKDYTPTDMSAAVLNKLKKVAENELGKIAEAVVTVPANFPNEAREATLEAAKRAGLNVKYIINEPTAAALYYAFKEGKELSGNYAVYDLGGGTFDISIIRLSGQDVEVVASNGLQKLGGLDFDESLGNVVKKKYSEMTNKELEIEDYIPGEAEEDKKSLSDAKRIVATGKEIEGEVVGVKRAEFEESISSLIAQTEMTCQSTLEEAGLEVSDIKGCFLAGGSTRIPAVSQSVERVFGQKPISTVNVDEVVALGAALYAAYKSDGKHLSSAQKKSVEGIKFSEVTNRCYGTTALVHSEARGESELENVVLIRKGEKIPCSVTESFYTVQDGQERVTCDVRESVNPEKDPRFTNLQWEDSLELPPGRPKGRQVEITLSYNDNQTMRCTFRDVESGRVLETKLEMGAGSTNDQNSEIDKFLVD